MRVVIAEDDALLREGIVAAKAAKARHPGLSILVLSAYVEPAFATTLLANGAAGIGYLLKERVGRVADFLDALHRVAIGGTAIDPDLVAQLFARHHVHEAIRRLTTRENEVLALMAQGLGNAAVAARLVVTERAVHKHVRNIFAKLGLHPADDSDRRVMAVLRYVEHQGNSTPRPSPGSLAAASGSAEVGRESRLLKTARFVSSLVLLRRGHTEP